MYNLNFYVMSVAHAATAAYFLGPISKVYHVTPLPEIATRNEFGCATKAQHD